jgi:transcriptional regulator with XRE-family HTH domain
MQDLDKGAMGRRIRQIRLGASLRQWELAKLLGTTQSAVHKYEHGVVPEPRRLVELARIGGTSIEWVLTGQHWENGSEEQQRISPDLLGTACMLREISEESRESVNEALRIIREAVTAIERGDVALGARDPHVLAESLRHHSTETLRLLESAERIQRAVIRRVTEDAEKRLRNSKLFLNRPKPDDERSPAAGGGRSRS